MLYHSFRDYAAAKKLDGEFKYQAGGFGLQDARKRVTFQSFPPVLHLRLKRYRYDIQLDTTVKVWVTFSMDYSMVLTLPGRSMIASNSPWKSTLLNSSTRPLIEPDPGSTSFRV